MMRSGKWWLGLGALVGLGLAGVRSANAETLEWREEVALHDGGTVMVKGSIRLVPGEPFKTMPGARRLTFTHPTTGQPLVWENAGKIGSRVNSELLDFDGDRAFLVATAQAVTDYNEFGCPTPPYIVFRYDAGAWVRVPLATLLPRFVRMNLYPNPNQDRLKALRYFIRAAETSKRYRESYAPGDEYSLRATVDRRIRNPRFSGCGRGAIERVYGAEKYQEWKGTGNWLDKTEDEAMKLLWGDMGPPCPSRSACLPCRTSPATTDGVCGWVLWLKTTAGRYAKEAEVSRVSDYRTHPECDRVLAKTLTEQGKLDNRTVSREYGEVITWLGKRGDAPTQIQKWECLPDVLDPRGADHVAR